MRPTVLVAVGLLATALSPCAEAMALVHYGPCASGLPEVDDRCVDNFFGCSFGGASIIPPGADVNEDCIMSILEHPPEESPESAQSESNPPDNSTSGGP